MIGFDHYGRRTEIDIRDTRHERNLEVNYKCRLAQWKNYREQEFT